MPPSPPPLPDCPDRIVAGGPTVAVPAAQPAPGLRWAAPAPWHAALTVAQHPTPVPAPRWVCRNTALLTDLGWPAHLLDDAHLPALSGSGIWPGTTPTASVYSGHQFGVWAGQLGDGRALSLGQAESAIGPQEIQLKGAGPTPFSRGGDGRAVLRSSIREYLCSEAMHGLGVPTTRALCLVASPLTVWREQAESAAIVTRVAPSFLRFGHFEHVAAAGRADVLHPLVSHTNAHHLPEAAQLADQWQGDAAAGLLHAVVQRTARLMAQWQALGFCHGVMNTDNMSVLGLTIDYGPFQFMDAFDPGHICNHSDAQGRYAFANQPSVAHWNLQRLAQALALVGQSDALQAVLATYPAEFANAMHHAMCAKLGLTAAPLIPPTLAPTSPDASADAAADAALIDDVLALLADEAVDYTIFWRALSTAVACASADDASPAWAQLHGLFAQHTRWRAWLQRYTTRLQWQLGAAPSATPQSWADTGQRMRRSNPAFVLRNHLLHTAIAHAQNGDFSEVARLQQWLHTPYDDHPACADHAQHPPTWAAQLQLSCSS